MSKDGGIPKGYMTVGEIAKKMGTTVRTLQYYDKEGLLSPSSESQGGRRLYTDKDMIKLHQILSLKSLGFSLEDIRDKLVSLDTPAEVAHVLTEQAASIREKMKSLLESLEAVEGLKAEVLQMQSVDFKKYADIIVNLRMKNEFYWLIKHFDESTLEHIRGHFDKESGLAFIDMFNRLSDEAIQYQEDNILPESHKGQAFAKKYWDMIMEFTGGDMSMLPKLMEFSEKPVGLDNKWKEKQNSAERFIKPALGAYFIALGYDPLGEGTK
ncbi:MerR family transcriptional regulator [Anaerosporobacter sp.]|uniref:MerR family transcriptional regulator n=1 Tax=Anaerosporobacter sp. TaxID=1872529 RepID=UPI00286EBECC|nr:MerR family transcriptional regulator [Anaerosporobacter sp.]